MPTMAAHNVNVSHNQPYNTQPESNHNDETLPVINLCDPIDQIASELKNALSTKGFVYCANHGIEEEIKQAFHVAEQFFHQSLEIKQRALSVNRALRGYSPVNTENFASLYGVRATNDHVEKFRIGPLDSIENGHNRSKSHKAFYFPNTWPHFDEYDSECSKDLDTSTITDNNVLDKSKSNFQKSLETLYIALSQIAEKVAQALAISLDLPLNYFKSQMKQPTSILSANRYPASTYPHAEMIETQIAPHTDVSLFTIVCQQDTSTEMNTQTLYNCEDTYYSGGLEVNFGEDEWIQAYPIPNTVVINVGDCLSDWTGGVLKSTVHRVRPLMKRRRYDEIRDVIQCQERLSLAFFCTPDPETNVHPDRLQLQQKEELYKEKDLENEAIGTSLQYSQWRKDRVKRAMQTLKST